MVTVLFGSYLGDKPEPTRLSTPWKQTDSIKLVQHVQSGAHKVPLEAQDNYGDTEFRNMTEGIKKITLMAKIETRSVAQLKTATMVMTCATRCGTLRTIVAKSALKRAN